MQLNKLKSECVFMEKYYCDYCRVLYDQEEYCEKCGTLANNKIMIDIQTQKEKP